MHDILRGEHGDTKEGLLLQVQEALKDEIRQCRGQLQHSEAVAVVT